MTLDVPVSPPTTVPTESAISALSTSLMFPFLSILPVSFEIAVKVEFVSRTSTKNKVKTTVAPLAVIIAEKSNSKKYPISGIDPNTPLNFARPVTQAIVENNRIPMSINYLRWPPHLQSTLLDGEVREEMSVNILKTCEKWLKYYSPDKFARLYLEEWDQVKRFCDYLVSEQTQYRWRKDFVKFIQSYDMRRDKDFKKTFPMYAHLLREWNV